MEVPGAFGSPIAMKIGTSGGVHFSVPR
jgi:hypothetical protein